jgi:hypothetical protein
MHAAAQRGLHGGLLKVWDSEGAYEGERNCLTWVAFVCNHGCTYTMQMHVRDLASKSLQLPVTTHLIFHSAFELLVGMICTYL